ncbi:MAG: elongation factor P [Spirochaeta sp. LUC14_002_19_P3]|nr:MAG: elongation factor P [Spirochaeta sp. LUC14_002_19_P3]
MGTIKAGAIAKGTYLLEKNEPFVVNEREFVNPGKGSAFVRLKLKNLRTGAVLKITHKSQDSCEEIDVEEVESQFLYSDGTAYHFMESQTFEQFEVPILAHEDAQYFMLEGESFKITRWNGETLDIRLPPKKDLIVAEAEEAVKGDTVTGASKYVITETGLTVKVPIFIKKGEKIRISVETKEYQERVND